MGNRYKRLIYIIIALEIALWIFFTNWTRLLSISYLFEVSNDVGDVEYDICVNCEI